MQSDATTRVPWMPLTFGGIAAFGRAALGRTLTVATVMAVLYGLTMVWLTSHSFVPPVDQLVERLPETGEIRGRELHWGGEATVVLADSKVITVVVDLEGTKIEGRIADLIIKLRRNDYELCSLFGCATFAYPTGWVVTLNQPETKPLWGAWRPFLIVGVFLVSIVGVMVLWVFIATASFVPVRLILYFLDRDVTLAGTWRVLMIALLPGAALLTLGIVGYSLQQITLTGLLVIAAVHVVVDVVYWAGACWRLPLTSRRVAAKAGNPFSTGTENPS